MPTSRRRQPLPSRPGEFHPEPLTDPYVNLSIHTARVIARRLPPSAEPSGSSRFDPVGPCSTTMTCLLGSAGITPLDDPEIAALGFTGGVDQFSDFPDLLEWRA